MTEATNFESYAKQESACAANILALQTEIIQKNYPVYTKSLPDYT